VTPSANNGASGAAAAPGGSLPGSQEVGQDASVMATIPVGTAPVALAVTSDGNHLYVANQGAVTSRRSISRPSESRTRSPSVPT